MVCRMDKVSLLKALVNGLVMFVFYFIGYYIVAQDFQETLSHWPVAASISVFVMVAAYLKQRH